MRGCEFFITHLCVYKKKPILWKSINIVSMPHTLPYNNDIIVPNPCDGYHELFLTEVHLSWAGETDIVRSDIETKSISSHYS